jgi:hypothetical protein
MKNLLEKLINRLNYPSESFPIYQPPEIPPANVKIISVFCDPVLEPIGNGKAVLAMLLNVEDRFHHGGYYIQVPAYYNGKQFAIYPVQNCRGYISYRTVIEDNLCIRNRSIVYDYNEVTKKYIYETFIPNMKIEYKVE